MIKGRKFPHDPSWLRLSPCNGSQPGCPHLPGRAVPHRIPPPACPHSGCCLSLLLVGDPLSQPPLGVQLKASLRLCQGCWLPGHLTLAATQGRDRLREKNLLSSAQIASVNLFQIRYIISVITNPLTCAPSASGTVSSAAWKGLTLQPAAETGGNRDGKRGLCSLLGSKLILAAHTPLRHLVFYCYLQGGKGRRKMKNQRNCILKCII